MGEIGLLQHRDRLRTLPGSAQRLTELHRRIDILRVGAILFAIHIDRTLGIIASAGFRARAERSGDVRHTRRLTAAQPNRYNRTDGRGPKKPGETRLLTHGTLTRDCRQIVAVECLDQ